MMTEFGETAPPASGIAPRVPLPRPFLGILFSCCGVYARVYRNMHQSAYVGACPRCGSVVRVGIAPGGTSSRFFIAD
ncbi:MAG: hypothetical protein IPM64_11950 [Phycisphaerales bacterium]|nr:hypothetical protein [Phycisphaerales bacterium]